MSNHWRNAVRTTPLEPYTKLVLYSFAAYVNDFGTGAPPSIETLADDCGLPLNETMIHLLKAVQAGFLKETAAKCKVSMDECYICLPKSEAI